ncbi:MAG: 50S ribosomal protein L32 [Desulfomicrobium escambiense]|nr:50S ribosomal protein L32 [Desulfomicrobium escambiense]
MPNPKRRHSPTRKGKRRAHDGLDPADLLRLRQVRQPQVAPPGLPPSAGTTRDGR